MLYARSDVAAFSGTPDCTFGGHTEKADPDDPHFSIDCGDCEVHLRDDPLWAAFPQDVPLTKAEEKALEAEQHEANLGSAAMGLALQQLLREQMAKNPPAPALEAAKPVRAAPARKPAGKATAKA